MIPQIMVSLSEAVRQCETVNASDHMAIGQPHTQMSSAYECLSDNTGTDISTFSVFFCV